MKMRNKFISAFKSSRDNNDWKQYKYYRNSTVAAVRKAKKTMYTNILVVMSLVLENVV